MVDSYRPGRPDRDRAPPLADRMTFTSGGGDSYRPGVSHRQQGSGGNHSEFTFQSNHAAPQFPPTGPANSGPPRKRNRGGTSQRDSRRNDPPDSSHSRGRNNAHGFRRGGFRKAAPHQRALLQQRDEASPERIMGVSDGPNRFLNVDDLSDDEEADMDVESDKSIRGDDEAVGQDGNQKVARTQTISRADGNSVPKWSNPDPYTVLPPPEETTGKKTDFVKLIRKAKNQAAEKAAGHNAVAANDDFISFGDDAADEKSESQVIEDDKPTSRRRQANASSQPHIEGSMNDLAHADLLPNDAQNGTRTFESNGHRDDQPQRPVHNNKRKRGDFGPGIVQAWQPQRNSDPTPWLVAPQAYAHLARDPNKW